MLPAQELPDSLQWRQVDRRIQQAFASDDQMAVILTQLDVGNAFLEHGVADSAVVYYYNALELTKGKQVPDEYLIAAWLGMARAQHVRKKFSVSGEYYQKVINISPSDSLARTTLWEYLQVLNRDGQYDQAISYLSASEDSTSTGFSTAGLGTIGQKTKLFESASEAFEELGDFELANQFKDSFLLYYDRLLEEDKIRTIKEIETKHLLAEKEAQNQLLKAEKEQQSLRLAHQRTIIISLLIGIFLCACLMALLALLYQQKRRHNESLEIKVAEKTAELRLKNEQLFEYNQEMERFTHIASHDLREPLRSIVSYSSLVSGPKAASLPPEKIKQYFEQINRSARRLYRLVEDILSFSKAQVAGSSNLKSVELGQVVDSIEEAITTKLEETNAVIKRGTLPNVVSNESQLFLVLKNLIENGIKYNKSNQPTVEITYARRGMRHIINVQDNGIGISEDYISKVFDSFFRLHNREEYEGTGLGLAIVRRLVEKLGGTISATSEVGRGSTFTVQLPVRNYKENENSVAPAKVA